MEHLNALYRFIEAYVPLSENDRIRIASSVRKANFKKDDRIVELGQTSTTLYFVLSGIYRVYKLHNGKEITSYFNTSERNPFVASFVSLLTQTPSKEVVECIQNGELFSIPYDRWKRLYSLSSHLNTFGRIMAEYNYILAMERIEALQYHNATGRYNSFLKTYPNLINKISHHYIASYIGVAPESLSRLRKKLLDQDS